MDLSSAAKKRKADENGGAAASPHPSLSLEDAHKIVSSFTPEQLQSIVASSMLQHPSVLDAVRSVADEDPAQRKLFIRGLGWETTTESLRALFSVYGELKEAVIICDKATGKSKGYGFITYKHIDGAILALKEPSKKIDGRMTVTQLASAGNTGSGPAAGPTAGIASTAAATAPQEVASRKIYVGAVPPDMSSDRLLQLFSTFGEIEEGPLGFDKQTGKLKGYALFVYKTAEAASAAVQEPTKIVDGHQLVCRFAIDGKKKPGMFDNKPGTGSENRPGEGIGGFGSQSSIPGSLGSQFGGSGSGLSSYGFFPSGGAGLPGPGGLGNHHLNSPLQSLIGSGSSGQVPSSMGGSGGGGYGSVGGFGGAYGSASQFSGGPGPGGYGGLGMGMGMGSSLYNRLPPSSGGMGSGGFSEGGPYSLSSLGHSGQHHQSGGSPPGPRIPPGGGGGMYQGMPPYY